MARKKVKDMNRKQQKAVFYNMSQLHSRMNHRSPHAQAVDRGKKAQFTYNPSNDLGKAKWMKNPNKYDIEGIDNLVKQQQYKSRKSKQELKQKKKELSEINKEIKKKPTDELKKQQQQKQKEYQQTEKQHIQNKRNLDHIKNFAYYHLSPEKQKQIQRLTPSQEQELYKDVEKWYGKKQSNFGFSKQEIEERHKLDKKYNLDNVLSAYVGLKGQYPKIKKKPRTSYAMNRLSRSDSLVRTELDNTVRLDKLRTSLNSLESKSQTLESLKSDLRREKEWYQENKKELENKNPQMITSTEEKQVNKYRDNVEKTEVEILNKQRAYDKYLENRKKDIAKLRDDPNITFTRKSDKDYPDSNRSTIVAKYQGKTVTATKTIRDIENDVLKEVGLFDIKKHEE